MVVDNGIVNKMMSLQKGIFDFGGVVVDILNSQDAKNKMEDFLGFSANGF